MTLQELGKQVKVKYPQYNNVDDTVLANKIIEKYPVYSSKIDKAKVEEVAKPKTTMMDRIGSGNKAVTETWKGAGKEFLSQAYNMGTALENITAKVTGQKTLTETLTGKKAVKPSYTIPSNGYQKFGALGTQLAEMSVLPGAAGSSILTKAAIGGTGMGVLTALQEGKLNKDVAINTALGVAGPVISRGGQLLEKSGLVKKIYNKFGFIRQLVKPVETTETLRSQVDRTKTKITGLFKKEKDVVIPPAIETITEDVLRHTKGISAKNSYQRNYNVVKEVNLNNESLLKTLTPGSAEYIKAVKTKMGLDNALDVIGTKAAKALSDKREKIIGMAMSLLSSKTRAIGTALGVIAGGEILTPVVSMAMHNIPATSGAVLTGAALRGGYKLIMKPEVRVAFGKLLQQTNTLIPIAAKSPDIYDISGLKTLKEYLEDVLKAD